VCPRGESCPCAQVHISSVYVYENLPSPPKSRSLFAGCCALSFPQPPLRPITTCASHTLPLHAQYPHTHHSSILHHHSSRPSPNCHAGSTKLAGLANADLPAPYGGWCCPWCCSRTPLFLLLPLPLRALHVLCVPQDRYPSSDGHVCV